MEAPISTSFDRFARYSYLRRVRDQWFGEAPVRVLDVGDPYGTLTGFLPDDITVSLDLFADRRGGYPAMHPHVIGSGFSLPFPDASFDIVASHDVYEHLPVGGREAFVAELVRVSAGPVVLVAPFADPRTAACEAMVNAYYVSRTGHTLDPLDEHREGGLPPLAELETFLDRLGVERHVHGDGWLFHWLTLMLMKAHMVAGGMAALDRAIDTACNQLLRARDARLPGYRRAVVIRPLGAPVAPMWVEEQADVPDQVAELTALGWELVAVLPAGQDLSDPGSALRSWVRAARDRGGDVEELAESLELVLDRAHQTLSQLGAAPAEPLRVAVVLVADGDDWQAVSPVLEQLGDQTHPADSLEVVVVVSTESAADHLTAEHPGLRVVVEASTDPVLRLNRGVAEAGAEAVLLLDPTLRVGPDLVEALAAKFDPATRTSCVAADLEPLLGCPVLSSVRADGDEVLYAPAGAMLVQRRLYLDVGGFDGAFGGVLDDVDFGWRITNLGYRVARGDAVVHRAQADHRDDLTAPHWTRNLLRMLVKNLEPANLAAALSAELLSLAHLAKEGTGDGAAPEAIDAIAALGADLDSLLSSRDGLLWLRQVSDETVLERFGRPGTTGDRGAHPVARRLSAAFERSPSRADGGTSVLVVVDGGRVRHSFELARLAGIDGSVVLAAREPLDRAPDGVKVVVWETADHLRRLAEDADVVVVPARTLGECPALATADAALVVDLREASLAGSTDHLVLRRGDAFLVGSEAQRDHWLGHLAAIGRPLPQEQRADGSLRRLIDTVYTAPAPNLGDEPASTRPVVVFDLRGVGDDSGAAQELLAEVPQLRAAGVQVVCTSTADPSDAPLVSGAIVVRPTGIAAGPRLGSSTWALDAVAAGAALVVTAEDPAAPLVEAHGCGVSVARPGRVVDALRALLADPARLSAAQAASLMLAAGIRSAGSGQLVGRVVRAPWSWKAAHLGGSLPRAMASPEPTEPSQQSWRERVDAAEVLLQERARLIDALERGLHEAQTERDLLSRRVAALNGSAAVRAVRKLLRLVGLRL